MDFDRNRYDSTKKLTYSFRKIVYRESFYPKYFSNNRRCFSIFDEYYWRFRNCLDDWIYAWRSNVLLVVTIGIALVIALWWWRERNKKGIESWLFILILVGACGNIYGRMTLGYVVDFIDWYVVWDGTAYHWPAFNLADSCISIAVVLLLISSFRKS